MVIRLRVTATRMYLLLEALICCTPPLLWLLFTTLCIIDYALPAGHDNSDLRVDEQLFFAMFKLE